MRSTTVKLLFSAALAIGAVSCNNSSEGNADQNGKVVEEVKDDLQSTEDLSTVKQSSFNIDDIPVSEENLGDFPFFSLPEGLATTNKPIERKYDILYFPIDGVMTPLEGKVWKSYISAEDRNSDDWSLAYFQKSYDEAITSVGGVKIFDGEITNDEYERYHDQATYLGEDGSIGYVGQNIKVYVIRQSNGNDVYIQLAGNTASGNLNILQKKAFKQTISMLKSDEISKQLDEKGKAVLHINFDTDKASLKPDGKAAGAEIVKVLKADPSLEISINGYTDNSGSPEHNKTLSESRAKAVKDEITKAGIESGRLSSQGFGQRSPISDNSTEEGKAQNRRVELVKR